MDRIACDLLVERAAERVVEETDCDAIVNAAAYTAVDQAETDREAAFAVNARAAGEMARAAARKSVPFIHFSTDYVFDGTATHPYRETDLPAPLSVYGASKLAGEEEIEEADGIYAVIRTSWVFSARRANFVKSMLRAGAERPSVRVVADQRGKPTDATSAAEAVFRIAGVLAVDPGLSGVYHFASREATNRAEFAEAIFATAGLKTNVERVATLDFPMPAPRPLNSVLDTSKICRVFAVAPPSWRETLRGVVAELQGKTQ